MDNNKDAKNFEKPKLSAPASVQKKTGWKVEAKKIADYIICDVLVPNAKDTLQKIVTNGIDMLLYGESRNNRANIPAARVSYGAYYDSERRNSNRPAPRSIQSTPARMSYDQIALRSREDAIALFNSMEDWINRYTFITVATMFDLADLSDSSVYTDNSFGWTSIRSIDNNYGNNIYYQSGGWYYLKLPKPMPID